MFVMCAVMFILALVGVVINLSIMAILGGHGHGHSHGEGGHDHGHGHGHSHSHSGGHSHGEKHSHNGHAHAQEVRQSPDPQIAPLQQLSRGGPTYTPVYQEAPEC